ncbi:LPS O-antigen chain length determinant protein WzzB [Pseudomonas sp. NFIX28]|uniref:LPS O-antigen chain length determinant protein WzzB n=1 Tax=Pseudomonas sp. NFIX28 TaxID=1566235 RepID=UPI000895FAF0|nr:Wzz/FepE/Etk N-terminal domain-containing protein [Pseudomonas sp. NFIX28]SDY98439.1 chain length determinant protein (polysaccharide antigen chain regulator) [Pseudomonas sp. NFIX28]
MLSNSSSPVGSDEVDLRALFDGLWLQRWLIFSIAAVATLIALCYALLVAPVYESKVYVIPPTQNEIANFNYGRISETGLSAFTVKDIYSVFLVELQSESRLRAFFNEVYLPGLGGGEQKRSEEALYADLVKALTVSSRGADRYQVAIQGADPDKIALWLREYVVGAAKSAKMEILKNINREAEVRARDVGQQISVLRESSEKKREDSIARLREALTVADKIGLEVSPAVTGGILIEMQKEGVGQELYMRGARALRAEIANLEKRASQDPFTDSLREHEARYHFYMSLTEFSPRDVEVYRMDGVIKPSDRPVKPQKEMIVLIGLLLGVIAGFSIALLRISFRRA